MNKRLIALICICAFLFALSSCGRKQEGEVKLNETTVGQVETEETNVETTVALSTMYTHPDGEGIEFVGEPDEDAIVYDDSQEANQVIENTQSEQKNNAESTPNVGNQGSETVPPSAGVTENASCGCEYEAYLAMSAAEQEAYMDSFASPKDFISWSRNAEAEHAAHNTVTNVTGGDLDIGDFID